MSAPILKTLRLVLRHWTQADFPIFAELNKDPKVMEFFPSILSREESDDFAKKIERELMEKDYGLWAVELKQTHEFIGCIGLHYQDFQSHFTPCIEIGWRLKHEMWGKGYAFEGASKVLEYATIRLGLDEVVSFTSEKNIRSRKLMEKLGMIRSEKEDFEHPKLSQGHPLKNHVLYRKKLNKI